ncbi:MAG: hypothetical protein OXU34_05940 [Gammaproteobacteria bacterium]|nr:hypothetical protein [Gammaproteobacteria bacterium]
MKHYTSPRFWRCFDNLPAKIQSLAHDNFSVLKQNPEYPSLHLKKISGTHYWSVRIGLHYRALGVNAPGGIQWFWIGTHARYNQFVNQ